MTNLLAALLGLNPTVLQLITALLGFVTVIVSATATVIGLLNRRIRLRAETSASKTETAVQSLTKLLAEQHRDFDTLWAAFLAKDTIANPEGVRRIARETAEQIAEEQLRPMQKFYAAIELVEHRREHRPETDVIRVLQEITA